MAATGRPRPRTTSGTVPVPPVINLPPEMPTPDSPGTTGGYRNAPTGAPTVNWNPPTMPGGPPGGNLLVVDSASLSQAISKLQTAATEAESASSAIASAVTAAGTAPWGDDSELGTPFAANFQQPQQDLLSAVNGISTVLDKLATSLSGALQQFNMADEETQNVANVFPSPGAS